MSRVELINRIELLRSKMNRLAAHEAEFLVVLRVSQKLDELIVMYHRSNA